MRESWFSYGVGFRRNFAALPLDEQSCVVRTIKSNLLPYVRGDVWHYTMQRGTHFVRKLSESGYSSIDQVMLDAVEAKHERAVARWCCAAGPASCRSSAAAKWRFSERQRRQKTARRWTCDAARGNRECASEFDRDRKQKAEQDLKALDKRMQTTQP